MFHTNSSGCLLRENSEPHEQSAIPIGLSALGYQQSAMSYCFSQLLQKHLSKNFPRPEAVEVVGPHLAVYDFETIFLEVFDEADECHLGGIGDPAEHG